MKKLIVKIIILSLFISACTHSGTINFRKNDKIEDKYETINWFAKNKIGQITLQNENIFTGKNIYVRQDSVFCFDADYEKFAFPTKELVKLEIKHWQKTHYKALLGAVIGLGIGVGIYFSTDDDTFGIGKTIAIILGSTLTLLGMNVGGFFDSKQNADFTTYRFINGEPELVND